MTLKKLICTCGLFVATQAAVYANPPASLGDVWVGLVYGEHIYLKPIIYLAAGKWTPLWTCDPGSSIQDPKSPLSYPGWIGEAKAVPKDWNAYTSSSTVYFQVRDAMIGYNGDFEGFTTTLREGSIVLNPPFFNPTFATGGTGVVIKPFVELRKNEPITKVSADYLSKALSTDMAKGKFSNFKLGKAGPFGDGNSVLRFETTSSSPEGSMELLGLLIANKSGQITLVSKEENINEAEKDAQFMMYYAVLSLRGHLYVLTGSGGEGIAEFEVRDIENGDREVSSVYAFGNC